MADLDSPRLLLLFFLLLLLPSSRSIDIIAELHVTTVAATSAHKAAQTAAATESDADEDEPDHIVVVHEVAGLHLEERVLCLGDLFPLLERLTSGGSHTNGVFSITAPAPDDSSNEPGEGRAASDAVRHSPASHADEWIDEEEENG